MRQWIQSYEFGCRKRKIYFKKQKVKNWKKNLRSENVSKVFEKFLKILWIICTISWKVENSRKSVALTKQIAVRMLQALPAGKARWKWPADRLPTTAHASGMRMSPVGRPPPPPSNHSRKRPLPVGPGAGEALLMK